MNGQSRLSDLDRDALEAMMEARNADGPLRASIPALHGFLTSIVSGPIVMPSEWLPIVFGSSDDRGWDSMQEMQRAIDLLMGFYNEIASDLNVTGDYRILVDRVGDGADATDFGHDWCRGFVVGMSLRADEWRAATDDRELTRHMLPLVTIAADATPNAERLAREEHDAMLDLLPESALAIRDWWRAKLATSMRGNPGPTPTGTVRRSAPKVSANAPCPCGSGKKFKRCCSPLRAV